MAVKNFFRILSGVFALCLTLGQAYGQQITHGPIIGALSNDSAKVYVRTTFAASPIVEYGTDSTFATFQTQSFTTLGSFDNSGIGVLRGLLPDTVYYYRLRIANVLNGGVGRFRTYPQPGQRAKAGYVRLAFGSCMERGARLRQPSGTISGPTSHDSVFLPLLTYKPHLFINMGDWAYPNTDIANDDTIIAYTRDMSIIEEAYRVRYSADSYPTQAQVFRNSAIDYIWDDCDYVDGGSGGLYVATKYGNPDPPYNKLMPLNNRQNVREAYHRYFPHYQLHDTANGIYHSFKLGNVEVFVLDLRWNLSAFYRAFKFNGSTFSFLEPATDHTIMGAAQQQWLQQGLLNSTADWKIVVSSLTFHKGYDDLLDQAIALQSTTLGSLSFKDLAYKLVEGWPAYRKERKALLDYITAQNIKNVVVVSGDSHTSAIDDGGNGGLPELMAANLTVKNGEFLRFFTTLWNKCAQGVAGVPAKEAIGMIDAYGSDSLQMILLDKNSVKICSHTLRGNSSTAVAPSQSISDLKIYPNPASNQLTLEGLAATGEKYRLQFFDYLGKEVYETAVTSTSSSTMIDVSTLPRGLLILRVTDSTNSQVTKVVALN